MFIAGGECNFTALSDAAWKATGTRGNGVVCTLQSAWFLSYVTMFYLSNWGERQAAEHTLHDIGIVFVEKGPAYDCLHRPDFSGFQLVVWLLKRTTPRAVEKFHSWPVRKTPPTLAVEKTLCAANDWSWAALLRRTCQKPLKNQLKKWLVGSLLICKILVLDGCPSRWELWFSMQTFAKVSHATLATTTGHVLRAKLVASFRAPTKRSKGCNFRPEVFWDDFSPVEAEF